MKLIKPSFEILEQLSGLEGIYKQIEYAGRTCYKSHDKITEDSAKGFVDRMVKSGHGAMLEHGTVYLQIPITCENSYRIDMYKINKYSKTKFTSNLDYCYIVSNYRVLTENNWLDDLQYICEPTEYHEKRITVKFITDQGIMREFTRHRTMSFACESTRYCNYNMDKFENEVTFIIPSWLDIDEGYYKTTAHLSSGVNKHDVGTHLFFNHCLAASDAYHTLIKEGWKPQQVRNILPLATKCELIMTGYVSDWKHFLLLRTPVNAHPQARELAIPLQEEFIKRGYE